MTYIITHRGLDTEKHHTFTESSREAFQYFLDAGYGLEFDIQLTKDHIPVISHDTNLHRIAEKDTLPPIAEMTAAEFLDTPLPNGHTTSLDELMSMVRKTNNSVSRLHALHLKHHNQTDDALSIILPYLKNTGVIPLLIFDATVETAQKIKNQLPNIQIAASVAHSYDIVRYNSAVGGTLISIDELIQHKNLYSWAWLDEWDRIDMYGVEKNLYDSQTFNTLRTHGFKIAIVSPELHATSPKLLGGEAHPDGKNVKAAIKRWQEIKGLKFDAICTDYPKTCGKMFS